MQKYRPDISHTVERRAQEAAAGASGRVQPEYTRARTARKVSPRQISQPSHSAALTRRERRVKNILLKELELVYGKSGGGLTYSEKQHLQKTLNVEFIDRELEQMAKQEGRMRIFAKLDFLFLVPVIYMMWKGQTLAWGVIILPLLFFIHFVTFKWQIRSLQRRRFIYEALRELSDADEIDVTLDRVAREADALIEQIVERELALDDHYPVRPFLKA